MNSPVDFWNIPLDTWPSVSYRQSDLFTLCLWTQAVVSLKNAYRWDRQCKTFSQTGADRLLWFLLLQQKSAPSLPDNTTSTRMRIASPMPFCSLRHWCRRLFQSCRFSSTRRSSIARTGRQVSCRWRFLPCHEKDSLLSVLLATRNYDRIHFEEIGRIYESGSVWCHARCDCVEYGHWGNCPYRGPQICWMNTDHAGSDATGSFDRKEFHDEAWWCHVHFVIKAWLKRNDEKGTIMENTLLDKFFTMRKCDDS